VGGQVDAQVDDAKALAAQVARGGAQLGLGDAVEEHPPLAVEGAVELGMLAQVPVEGLEYRRAPAVDRPEHARPHHLQVVVDQVDAGPLAQRLEHGGHVGVGDAHDLGVRAGQAPELAVGEGAAPLVDLHRALLDGAQHHLDPPGPQLRDQGGEHVLDAPVVRRGHRKPGTGVDQHAGRHEDSARSAIPDSPLVATVRPGQTSAIAR
jgi:hypothetical protein